MIRPACRWLGYLQALVLLLSLCACAVLPPEAETVARTEFSTAFESGSIGQIDPLDRSGMNWRLHLRDDNDDPTLPDSFRNWWYVGINGLATGRPLTLQIEGFGAYYPALAVYSYDQKNWHHFSDDEAVWQPCEEYSPGQCRLLIRKTFASEHVWIARFYPYTTSDLNTFLESQAASPYMQVETLGLSPRHAAPIRLLTISAPGTEAKKIVWVNARTHPGETGPSFLLEGLIRQLLAEDATGRALRARYEFKIVPMHNVDGVIDGNYRTNADSVNLEESWISDPLASSIALDADAPPENRLLVDRVLAPLLMSGADIVLALNLHASNAPVDQQAFLFPHFGDDPMRFSPAQRSLWRKQWALIDALSAHYRGRIDTSSQNGGTGFLERAYPETWWWEQRQDAVTAITLETTTGTAGFTHWVEADDLRELGKALAKAIEELSF
ncbi:M14-type cytosolic carboxypeptidase [Herbaspirillum sp. RTI4]|uniref:M14-type cytosolic carboxypeptidase n=1 Tax=Herbaspirillum sp. RTI4 TaxID=3048640 RepID=UPI002AB3C678|nr:M14-type cytosolic carboxypeptidase [Herbaspirillum sp. RTI4]MDY7579248.1 M14-type cytosolic carboxypeptidase [Herbaspirillum sp. RTI4]MEA9982619.1 M14-type cytosolic carboxypeptidase [Herbaspirillum sp. RTI4]